MKQWMHACPAQPSCLLRLATLSVQKTSPWQPERSIRNARRGTHLRVETRAAAERWRVSMFNVTPGIVLYRLLRPPVCKTHFEVMVCDFGRGCAAAYDSPSQSKYPLRPCSIFGGQRHAPNAFNSASCARVPFGSPPHAPTALNSALCACLLFDGPTHAAKHA